MSENKSAKFVKQNFFIRKTNTFTIIASNFVRKQSKTLSKKDLSALVYGNLSSYGRQKFD